MKIIFVGLIMSTLIFVAGCKVMQNQQTIQISLKKKVRYKKNIGSVYLTPEKINPDASLIQKLSNKISVDTFILAVFRHFPEQYYYRSWVEKNIDSMYYHEVISKMYNINPTVLSSDKKYDSETFLIIGKKNDDCIIIADRNNNNDLGDDKILRLKKWFADEPGKVFTKRIKIKVNNLRVFYNQNEETFSQNLYLMPFRRDTVINGKYELRELSLKTISNTSYIGSKKLAGRRYRFTGQNTVSSGILTSKSTVFTVDRKNEKSKYLKTHDNSLLKKIGDTLKIQTEYYQLRASLITRFFDTDFFIG